MLALGADLKMKAYLFILIHNFSRGERRWFGLGEHTRAIVTVCCRQVGLDDRIVQNRLL